MPVSDAELLAALATRLRQDELVVVLDSPRPWWRVVAAWVASVVRY